MESLAGSFEELRADYGAAKTSRLRRRRTVPGSGAGGDYHYRSDGDYLRMMEYARDMDRNDAIVGQMVNRAVENTVQNGFQLQPDTGDAALDEDLWQRWQDWSLDPRQCSLDGAWTFPDIEEKTLRARLVDGDHLVNLTDEGSLQLIEAHRLRTPGGTKRNVVHGVLMDELRRRLEYWITKEDLDPFSTIKLVSDVERLAAFDEDGNPLVLHLVDPKRCTQTRGVTAFAPIFDNLGMFEDTTFAQLVQQQIVSCVTFIRTLAGNALPGPSSGAYGPRTEETMSDGVTRLVEQLAPGLEIQTRPGETVQGFSPNVPAPESQAFMKTILTLIGINLGLPLVMLLMDGSETNFSGWRGAIDQAKMGFRRNQRLHARQLHTPVYLWKLRGWIGENLGATYRRVGDRIFRHKWVMPTWPYIQPLQDAQADALRAEKLLTSPRRIKAEHGEEHETIIDEIVADNAYAIVAALDARQKITDAYPLVRGDLDWRELLYLAGSKPLTGTLSFGRSRAPATKAAPGSAGSSGSDNNTRKAQAEEVTDAG